MLSGRDRLHRFLPGDEWKKLPDSCKAPNRGRRLRPRPRHFVRFFCELCGTEAKSHRKSARYCSIECRRRANWERDAIRRGRPRPAERVRGAERRWLAIERGIRQFGSRVEYEVHLGEKKRKAATVKERSRATLSPQEEWMNYHRSGLTRQAKSEIIRYARFFRPQTAR